ncbi:MAG TPA: RMD1 family protein [Polyangiaceae bacterium]|nr:RMD1 family protein [Polyangiaceae bacterium]
MDPAARHLFHAQAFVENLPLKELTAAYPEARRTPHELSYPVEVAGAPDAAVFVYPFGVVVFFDVPPERRDPEVARLHAARQRLGTAVATEELTVLADQNCEPDVADGVLTLDRLTPGRAKVVAITVAQSAAMEYYERIVEDMFARTDRVVSQLELRGTVSFRTRPLHQFIGTAIGTRNEVLSILHLLDKPDEAWDDPGMDRIYGELRAEFDLGDRYRSLELKLHSVQESLELVLDVARDRRLVLLETIVVLLILSEILLAMVRMH